MTDTVETTGTEVINVQYETRSVAIADIQTTTPGFINSRQTGATNVSELKDSIKVNGLMNPLMVWETDDGLHLIAGFRRLRALQELSVEEGGALQGLTMAPVNVYTGDLDGAIALNAVENLQREGLPGADVMDLVDRLSVRGNTQVQIGLMIGWSQPKVSNFLGYARTLSDECKDAWRTGKIEQKHAKQLATLTHKDGKPNVPAQAEALNKLTALSTDKVGIKKPTKERTIRSKDDILGLRSRIVANGDMDQVHRASLLTLIEWFMHGLDDGDVLIRQPPPPVASAVAPIKEAKRVGRPAKADAAPKKVKAPAAEGEAAPKRSLKDRAAKVAVAEAPAAEVAAEVAPSDEVPAEVSVVVEE